MLPPKNLEESPCDETRLKLDHAIRHEQIHQQTDLIRAFGEKTGSGSLVLCDHR